MCTKHDKKFQNKNPFLTSTCHIHLMEAIKGEIIIIIIKMKYI